MFIEDWIFYFGNLRGYIVGKEGIDPTILAVTSRIVSFNEDDMSVTTLSGSVYMLGNPNGVLENEVKYLKEFLNEKN